MPKKDRKHPQTSDLLRRRNPRLSNTIHNGDYQQIFWLGVSGFVIVNHPDREILLVDPWPSYCSRWVDDIPFQSARPLTNKTKKHKKRIEQLANFLRRSAALDKPYKVSAILLSHMHFDHADDIALLLELMHAAPGAVLARNTLTFTVEGPAIPTAKLPVLVGDFDTVFYLKTQYFDVYWRTLFDDPAIANGYWVGKQQQAKYLGKKDTPASTVEWQEVVARYGSTKTDRAWREITQNGERLYYDDTFNARVLKGKRSPLCPKPGAVADPVILGASRFHIVPYVWDHMNTPFITQHSHDALDDQASGGMQRISAFSISRKNVQNAKRTFIVGSAGEMAKGHTQPPPQKTRITTDLLIQATSADSVDGALFLDYPLKGIMKESRRYTFRNIAIKDYLVYSHFEEFVKSVADTATFVKNRETAVKDNVDALEKMLTDPEEKQKILPDNRTLLKEHRVFVLNRCGFEAPMPRDAAALII